MFFSASPTHTTQRGFGLVELMVSIGIITLITSLVMVRHSSFNSAVLEENQAYEVAFDIRQTQTRAISPQVGITGDVRGGYGIRFVDGRTYEIFQRTGGSDVVVERRQLDERFRLELASNFNTIFFQRPDFDAVFENGSGAQPDAVVINIAMMDGGQFGGGRNIEVTNTGQVSIRRVTE